MRLRPAAPRCGSRCFPARSHRRSCWSATSAADVRVGADRTVFSGALGWRPVDARTGLPRVGMVGGGQLARMTHQAAIALGQTLRVLATSPDDSAALVTPEVELGHHTDLDALRAFAAGCDVITFDHEHVPNEHIRTLVAEGHTVYPGADALEFAQDKSAMRRRLTEVGAPVPPFAVLQEFDDEPVLRFGTGHGWPVVAKSARGGYD